MVQWRRDKVDVQMRIQFQHYPGARSYGGFEQGRLGTEGTKFNGRGCSAWSSDLQLSRPAYGPGHRRYVKVDINSCELRQAHLEPQNLNADNCGFKKDMTDEEQEHEFHMA